jgi:hypothetical protein
MINDYYGYIVIVICAIGYGWSQYHSGVKFGAEKLLEILERENIIYIDPETEKVTPYCGDSKD